MERKYYEVPGRCVIEIDSDLYRCIAAVAEKENESFDYIVKAIIHYGLLNHMKSNLELIYGGQHEKSQTAF